MFTLVDQIGTEAFPLDHLLLRPTPKVEHSSYLWLFLEKWVSLCFGSFALFFLNVSFELPVALSVPERIESVRVFVFFVVKLLLLLPHVFF